jgi:hypothetical protein
VAKIRIAAALLESLLFDFSECPVRVNGAGVDPDGCLFLMIEGADVPAVPEVQAICTVLQNRAGQRLVSMKFEAVNIPGKT